MHHCEKVYSMMLFWVQEMLICMFQYLLKAFITQCVMIPRKTRASNRFPEVSRGPLRIFYYCNICMWSMLGAGFLALFSMDIRMNWQAPSTHRTIPHTHTHTQTLSPGPRVAKVKNFWWIKPHVLGLGLGIRNSEIL